MNEKTNCMTDKKVPAPPRYLVLLILNVVSAFCWCQETNYVNGKVADEATGNPVPDCSVYFSNTSKGDITSASGEFILKNLPAGRYEMIISAIGYETAVIPVASNNYPHDIRVSLHIISTQLSEVILLPELMSRLSVCAGATGPTIFCTLCFSILGRFT